LKEWKQRGFDIVRAVAPAADQFSQATCFQRMLWSNGIP
jgi:hypothetical protein